MKLRTIFVLTLAPIAAFAGPLTAQDASRPNIIHIMADDLGWRDLSVYGSETFSTPHLDRLAERGMLFSNAYSASPLCSPTRAATLAGQTVGRLRLTAPHGHLPRVVLNPRETDSSSPGMPMTEPQTRSRLPLQTYTLGNLFKEAGYTTAFMGKWHLGSDPFIPENFGFDVVVGGRGDPGPPQSRFFGPWEPQDNMPEVEGNPNADDVLGDAAVDFIADHADEPFFLALWTYNPHSPFEGKPEVIEAHRPIAQSAWYQESAIMGSMVKTIDDNVGKVMAELERQGLLENTLVIFTSDNGGNMYDRPEGVNPTNNHPLRAGKGNSYEGGVRVPLIVSWPGVVEPGSFSDAINISYDWFPTFAEILGAEAPEGHPIDGTSLLPVFRGEPLERGPIFSVFPHTVLATGNVSNVWMRDGQWKLLRFFNAGPDQTDELELYDLSRDIGETRNLAPHHPDIVRRMNEELSVHLEETETLLPRRNPAYNPEMRQADFQMIDGGFFVGGANDDDATVTAKNRSVTLRYHVPSGRQGSTLSFGITTNCVVGVTAGPGEQPVFGKPAQVTPNLVRHRIELPLPMEVSGGTITVVFDLEQPGRFHLHNPSLD